MKVLVVDDVTINRLPLVALLEDDGHEVLEAGSCSEARACLSVTRFDLVLLDLGLPDGDGASLIPDIRSSPVTILVLWTGADTALAPLADGVHRKGDSYGTLQTLLRSFA